MLLGTMPSLPRCPGSFSLELQVHDPEQTLSHLLQPSSWTAIRSCQGPMCYLSEHFLGLCSVLTGMLSSEGTLLRPLCSQYVEVNMLCMDAVYLSFGL